MVGVESGAGSPRRHKDSRPPRPRAEGPSDHALLQRLRQGDRTAATELYVRYAHRLRALARSRCSSDLARRVEADDIVQSVFRSFFRKAESGYYDVPEGHELWNLLLVIALNKIRDQGAFHRAGKRDVRLDCGGQAISRFVASRTRADQAACAFLQLVIEEVLESLPAQYRRLVQLRIDGHDVAGIARTVGRPKRTVERVLQQFRQKLRTALD